MKELKVNEWYITQNSGSDFYACNGGYSIHFQGEYRNGSYFKILSYYDMHLKRCYTVQRYFYKIIPLVREMTFELLKNNMLWDYNRQCPALETYKKDMLPYYTKCTEKGLDIDPWFESLYN